LYDLRENTINKKPDSNIKIKAYLQLKFKPKFLK